MASPQSSNADCKHLFYALSLKCCNQIRLKVIGLQVGESISGRQQHYTSVNNNFERGCVCVFPRNSNPRRMEVRGGGESSSSGSWLATWKRVENYLYFSSLRDFQKSQVERWYPLLGRMVSTTLFHVALMMMWWWWGHQRHLDDVRNDIVWE